MDLCNSNPYHSRVSCKAWHHSLTFQSLRASHISRNSWFSLLNFKVLAQKSGGLTDSVGIIYTKDFFVSGQKKNGRFLDRLGNTRRQLDRSILPVRLTVWSLSFSFLEQLSKHLRLLGHSPSSIVNRACEGRIVSGVERSWDVSILHGLLW